MTIAIVHLSDIHFKADGNSLENKYDDLIATINEIAESANKVVAVFTGDIAFSGHSDEYLHALELVERLKKEIHELSVIACPGNHDCSFGGNDADTRDIVVQALKGKGVEEIKSGVIDTCCSTQEEYRQFCNAVLNPEDTIYDSNFPKIFSTVEVKYGESNILFHCYNSAWISELKEKQGTLLFPVDQLECDDKKSDFAVSIFHHPLNWFRQDHARQLKAKISETSDLVLTGHEHVPGKYSVSDLIGNSTLFVEGAELQNTHETTESGFNVIKLNLDDQVFEIDQYIWRENNYSIENRTGPKEYKRLEELEKKASRLTDEMQAYIDEPGMAFSHPRKEVLCLSDFYIYPDLRQISFSSDDLARTSLSASKLLTEENDDKHIIVYGIESSGKSSLCKMLFLKAYKIDLIPVIIRGQDLKKSNFAAFEKDVLRRGLQATYRTDDVISFHRRVSKRIVLFIDDFDLCPLNAKLRYDLLNQIRSKYSQVIVTASDTQKIEEVFDYDSETDDDAFSHYDLTELGHYQRFKLVEKWNQIGLTEVVEDAELIRKNNSTRAIVDEIIGTKFMPSTPFLVLAIIQMAESNERNLRDENTNGDYYSFLIGQALDNAGLAQKDFSAVHSYLTELAYFYFVKGCNECSRDELDQFHTQFSTKYDLPETAIGFGTGLIRAKILKEISGQFSFRYPYVYYYYVAKYLSKNSSAKDVKALIERLCSHLYMPVYANIVMFMTYDVNNDVTAR